MSTAFLPESLANGRIEVSVAWGADVTAAEGTWTWSDITADVLVADGAQIETSFGRDDEGSTTSPATCSMLLDNRAGAYSLGSQSSNSPYVRRGTPVRVRVSLNGGTDWTTRFQGYADTWQPTWDPTGSYAAVQLSASGTLRRLLQGASPIDSPMRRAMLARTDVVAYWPCEEAEGAQSISSGIEGHPTMSLSGNGEVSYPKFGASTDFIASAPLPVLNRTIWRGPVPTYTATGQVQMRCLLRLPDKIGEDSEKTILFSLITTGTASRWDVVYVNADGGNLALQVNTPSGRTELTYAGYHQDDTTRWMGLSLTQSGSNVNWTLTAVGQGYVGGGFASGTLNSRTVGRAAAVIISPEGKMENTVVGHVVVQNAVTSMFDDLTSFIGFDLEQADIRLNRLCAYEGIPLTVIGDTKQRMGPQQTGTLIDLLRECEAADGGLLLDGLGAGLTYVCGPARDNAATALTLDAAAGETDLQPVDDDQNIRNRVRAQRTRGGEATVEDADGPLGTTAIGVYDDTVTANIGYPDDVADLAGRAVQRGTIVGYRYPTASLAVHRDPGLAADVLALTPGGRVDITNPSSVRSQHPVGTVPLIAEGYSDYIDRFTWGVTLNCSSALGWRSATWAATTGDTTDTALRADTDGSSLAADHDEGDLGLLVSTPSGPLWTTAADDFPLYLDVGGVKVRATACTGTSSPQTFTTDALPRDFASGTEVRLWDPLPLAPWRSTDLFGRFTAGQPASAPALRDMMPRLRVLAADITTISSIDLVDVPGLAVDVDPWSRYLVEGAIFYDSATGPPGAEARFALSAAPDSGGTWATLTVVDGSGGSSGSLAAFRRVGYNTGTTAQTVAGVVGAGVGTAIACPLVGTLNTQYFSGSVCLRFGQLYEDATLTTIKAGSWLRLTKVKDDLA